jgi:alpha-glucosidase
MPNSQEPWWKRAVVYQIYPRSFGDANGDGVGDLRGVISHLDYLRELGVDAVWLSPFYPSPMADFGYDVSDYVDVDPLFGTLADFDELVAQAHARGIKVVIDWVPNHSSSEHAWFKASRSSRDDPKRDWYVWRDGRAGGEPPNNWRSAFRPVGRAWSFDEPTRQWYLHTFLPEQPDLNWENPELRAAMHDTLRFWLDRGVDGFRIDVAHALGKDPELRDGDLAPPPSGVELRHEVTDDQRPRTGQFDWPSVHDRLRGVREVLDEYDDRMAVGEVYILDQERLVTYVNEGDGLQLAHNFVFLNQPWSAERFRAVVDEFEALATETAWPAWALGNHDHPRIASRFDDGTGHGPARALVAATMVLTLRGTPFLFQGDELGLPDTPVPPERIVDVDGRDVVRTPIPWLPPSQAGPGAGFTTGESWLPMTPEAERLNAATEAADERSPLSYHRRLLAVRRATPALQLGSYRSLDAPAGVYAYERALSGRRVLVALNFTVDEQRLEVEGGEVLISTHRSGRIEAGELVLAPDEALVAQLQ